MKKPHLSLCMIVKNEEDNIARCLNSVKGVVDEMIIVDTGSTDKTIQICQSFQCEIIKFEWSGNFAVARNVGLERAKGEWILWLDADEEIDKLDKHKLLGGAYFENNDVLTIHLLNYHGDKVDKNHLTSVAHHRLFRNMGMRFTNKIHERMDFDHIPNERIGHLDVKVHHYGYLNGAVEKKGKTERNLKLLEEQIKEEENVYWAHYFIALEYYNMGEFEEALQHLNASILLFLVNKVLPPSAIYKLKYFILIGLERFSEALSGIEKAILLYPDFVDLQFYKGVILYNLKNYENAIQCFQTCLEMGEENLNHLILKGVGSFQAWNYIGRCQLKLGKEEEAVVSTVHSLLIAPEYEESHQLLHHLISEGIPVFEYSKNHFQSEELQKIISLQKKIKNLNL